MMGRPYSPVDDLSRHQTELATSLRVPFITSPYPRWFYVTAVVVDDNQADPLWGGAIPTDAEVRVVASFNDQYREQWYRDSYKVKMREFAPYDIDGGAVGRYLIKYAKNGGWGYRKHTWQYGPEFVPTWQDEPVGLVECLDLLKPHDRWEAWKAEHADVFGALAGGVS